MTVKSYFVNLWNAMIGVEPVCSDGSKVEHFESAGIAVGGLLYTGFILFWVIISSYGAAKLSWFYNVHNGDTSSATLWSVLCFFFPSFYYPYYAVSLNPLNNESGPAKGGRSRR